MKIANADVYCFQELEAAHFEAFKTKPFLDGYTGFYEKRSCSNALDGLGMFVNTDRFEIKDKQNIKFEVEKAGNRPNVALIALLECKSTCRTILVATTHVLWNPKRGDIKLAQLSYFFDQISKFLEKNKCQNAPIVVSGDFNLTPSSLLFDYIVDGRVRINQDYPQKFWSGQLKDIIQSTDDSQNVYSHCLNLSSSYHPHQHTDGEEYITCILKNDRKMVDFQFFGNLSGQASNLECCKILEPPKEKYLKHMPNDIDPSDHFYLMSEFAFSNSTP